MNLKTEINITEHLNKLKSVLVEGNPFTFSETIDPSQATNNYNSLESIIDGSRNIGTITLIGTQKPGEYEQIINMINKNGLNTIHVKSNPNKFYIVYRPGHEEEAWELYTIAEKYGGYFAHNATKQDSIRIGQLLGYNQSAIDAYVKKNHEWNPPETVDSVFESVKRLRKLMNLTEDVSNSDKENFRSTLAVLLQQPNSGRSIYGEESLQSEIKNAFSYTTRGTVKKTYPVNVSVYKSKNGSRYLAQDDDGDILAAAFVDNNNNLTGIITDMGYTNVGIGTNLTNFIKKINPSVTFDGVASKEGQKLINRTNI